MLDLTRIRDYGKEYIVYFRSAEEFKEFALEWDAIGGMPVRHASNLRRAEKADLCLFLTWRGNRRRHGWAWSDKSFCFDEHPEYEVHTLDDLRAGSDLGEISLSESPLDFLLGGLANA